MRSERRPAGQSGWVWRRGASLGGCVVEVPGPGRSRFWTDLTAPGEVIAFEAIDDIALTGLRRVFGADWHERVVASDPDVTDDADWTPPPLSEEWRRMALVEAVDQWWPWPIDASLLTIDRALALDAAGAPGMAAVTVATCSWRVVELRRATLAGQVTAMEAEIVRDAAALVVRSLVDEAEERRVLLELDESVAVDATDDDFAQLDAYLTTHADEAALTLGVDTESRAEFLVDPAAVGPRTLRYDSPGYRELRVQTYPDLDEVVVSVTLADGVDPDDGEAAQLVAYVADAATGEVLSRASLEADEASDDDGEMSAVLPLHGHAAVAIVVGLYDAGLGAETRPTPVGRALADADRHIVAAWAEARRAQAGGVPGLTTLDDVRDALDGYIEAARVQGPTDREVALRDAVRRQAETLASLLGERSAGRTPSDLALRPLLVELMGARS